MDIFSGGDRGGRKEMTWFFIFFICFSLSFAELIYLTGYMNCLYYKYFLSVVIKCSLVTSQTPLLKKIGLKKIKQAAGGAKRPNVHIFILVLNEWICGHEMREREEKRG